MTPRQSQSSRSGGEQWAYLVETRIRAPFRAPIRKRRSMQHTHYGNLHNTLIFFETSFEDRKAGYAIWRESCAHHYLK